MIKLAIVLTHNRTDVENAAQVEALKSLLTTVTDGPFTNPETGETWTTIHHEVTGLNIEHEVIVLQIVPFGITAPSNRYDINSGGIVYYGKGDEDKTGNHPRFFNWGLKRGTNRGADVTIHIEDAAQLTAGRLRGALNSLTNGVEFVEQPFGKVATLRLLRTVGQLKEDRGFSEAITEYKNRVVEKGLKHNG